MTVKRKITPSLFCLNITVIALFFCSATLVSAANLLLSPLLSPASGSYSVGDNFLVQIVVSSNDQSINAVSGTLTFPANKLQIVSLSKDSSIVKFWPLEPTFSNSSGKVNFEGVIFNPGFQGNSGVVLNLYMKAQSAGDVPLTFSSVSVLANDGQGTDVTKGVTGGVFSIKVAKVGQKTVVPEQVATTTSPSGQNLGVVPASSPLKSADILLGTKYGASAIIGTSDYGKSQVLLTFVALDGTKIFITGETDDNGDFSILVPTTLKHGTYTVTAVLIKDDGAHSASSNEILIQIGNIFSDIGWEFWLMVGLLVAVIIYLLIRVFSHVQKIRVSNKKKVREAEDVLHKTFNVLRDDLTEHQRTPGFKKDINDVEKVIDDEIKDLEV